MEITQTTINQPEVSLSSAPPLEAMEIGRIIQRTKCPHNPAEFVNHGKWLSQPEQISLGNCTSDPAQILQIFQCLGVGADAAFDEVETSFKEAQLLLDPKFLALTEAPPSLIAEAAQARQRIELAYRLLAAPYIREHFAAVLLGQARETKLAAPANRPKTGSRPSSKPKKPSKRSEAKPRAKAAKSKTKTSSKPAFPRNPPTAPKDKEPSPVLLKRPLKTSNFWKTFKRVALAAAIISALTVGYKKGKAKIDSLLVDNSVGRVLIHYAKEAERWWKQSAIKRQIQFAGQEVVNWINEKIKKD